jgi:hypothetical protein
LFREKPPAICRERNYGEDDGDHFRYFVLAAMDADAQYAIIDTASDVNIVSEDILAQICPQWRDKPSAGKIRLIGQSRAEVTQSATRWLDIRLQGCPFSLRTKFIVTPTTGDFLLGAELLQRFNISLISHPEGFFQLEIPYPNEPRRQRTKVRLQHTPDTKQATNTDEFTIQANEAEFINFALPTLSSSKDKVVLTNVRDQLTNSPHASQCIVFPSLSPLKHADDDQLKTWTQVARLNASKVKICQQNATASIATAMVVNMSDSDITVPAGQLRADYEVYSQTDYEIRDVLCNTNHSISENDDSTQVATKICSQVVSNLSETVKEKITAYYNNTDDVMNYETDTESPSLFDYNDTEVDPIDLIPWKLIDPRAHGYVTNLFKTWSKLLARHGFDCGSISKTLGTMILPLRKELPKARKVYHASTFDMQQMRAILQTMEKYGILTKAHTEHGSPVFLIRRKDPQAPMRLLAAICDLNECLQKPLSTLPSIPRLLDELTENGVSFASSIDLANGFLALSIHPAHRERAALSTPLGTYISNRCLMGLSSSPVVYSSKVWEAINTEPTTGKTSVLKGVCNFLDDIPVVTGKTDDELKDMHDHYLMLNEICYRLDYHRFKINPKKLILFQKEATILGHIISNDNIKMDPKRIQKMQDAPIFKDRKSAMVWSGLIASTQGFLPVEMAKAHAVISPLTSPTFKPFKISPEQKEAFAKIKEILTSHEFVVAIPKPENVKLLYSDSSLNSAAAILLDVDIAFEITRITSTVRRSIPLENNSKIKMATTKLGLNLEISTTTEKHQLSLFNTIADQLIQLNMTNFPDDTQELRTSVLSQMQLMTHDNHFRQAIQQITNKPHKWIDKHLDQPEAVDAYGFTLAATARFLARDILVINTETCIVIRYGGGDQANKKPPLWIAESGDDHKINRFSSLVNITENRFSEFTYQDTTETDIRSMTQDQIFDEVKKIIKKKGHIRHKVKAIAYASKIIPEKDRSRKIYELEAMAIIKFLHGFKPYLTRAAAIITVTDSRTAFFLLSAGTNISMHKIRRWNTVLHVDFPNILFLLVSTNEMWADVLTRLFDFPAAVERQIRLKQPLVLDVPELSGTLMTPTEVGQYADTHPDIVIETPPDKFIQAILGETEADNDQDADIEGEEDENPTQKKDLPLHKRPSARVFTDIIDVLEERLRPTCIRIAQEEEHPDAKTIFTNTHLIGRFSLHDGLIHMGDRIWIPPSMEGLVISYYHLFGGHGGRDKTTFAIRQRYTFPHLESKVGIFTRSCQTCVISNQPNSRKHIQATYPVPLWPFHTIFCDFLAAFPLAASGVRHFLTISCYLTKAVYLYPCKSASLPEVEEHFRTFFMHTNLATRVLCSDNGPPFRSNNFLLFMGTHRIFVPPTTPNYAQSHGAIEVQNKQLTNMMTKLTILKDSFDVGEIYHLAAILLNNSKNSTTGVPPSSVIFGDTTFNRSALGAPEEINLTRTTLMESGLADYADELHKELKSRLDRVRNQVEQTQKKMLNDVNELRQNKMHFKPGTVVFTRDHRAAVKGTSIKFRPKFNKSPYMILTCGPTTALIMRLVDGVPMRAHLDHLKAYTYDSEFASTLPKVVRDIIGLGLTPKRLIELAKVDGLGLVYTDERATAPPKPQRKKNGKPPNQKQGPTKASVSAPMIDYGDDDDDTPIAHRTRHRVHFDTQQPQ